MLKSFVAALAILIVGVIAAFLIYAHFAYPTTSGANVLSDMIYARQHPHIALTRETTAFLPYWRLGDIQYARYDLLSQVDFFALTIGPDGHIVRVVGNETEPGWRWWNGSQVADLIAKVQISGGSFGLTLQMLDDGAIQSFLSDPAAQQNLISGTLDQIRARHLNGVTLDFEYTGTPHAVYRRDFTAFARRFSAALRGQASGVSLSLTLLPLSGREPGLFDLPRLVPLFDRFIGMTYDYYNSATDVAGPEAPMTGFASHTFFFDVSTAYRDYLKAIPASKIVMGIPYSGWDWAVRKGKGPLRRVLPSSNPNSYAAILSYGRMRTFGTLKAGRCRWNKVAQEPNCSYVDSKGIRHDVWFENDRSIAVKESYARTHGFAGIAIWVLGYDSKYPDLWTVMRRTFQR